MKKKLYSLLALLFTFCGLTAMAQSVTDLSQISADKTYYLQAQRGSYYYTGSAIAAISTTTSTDDAYKFKFEVADADAGTYYIYSVGAAQYITNLTTLTSDKTSATAVSILDITSGISAGTLKTGTTSIAYPWALKTGNNLFQMDGTPSAVLGDWGVTWGSMDAGNQWKILETDIYDSYGDVYSTIAPYLVEGETGYVGSFANSDIEASHIKALQTAYAAFMASPSETTKAAVATALSNAKAATLTLSEDKYYILESKVGGNAYVTAEGVKADASGTVSGNLSRTSSTTVTPAMMWKFTRTGETTQTDDNVSTWLGAYTVSNANAASYSLTCPSSADAEGCTLTSAGSEFGIGNTSGLYYCLQTTISSTTTWLNAYNGNNYTNMGVWKTWSSSNADGNSWKFKEVDEIPVTVGSAGYATLCLPFAVTVPTSGKIGVYTASLATNSESGDDEISLTEVADGTTVTGKTPVVLVAEGGATENFAINYSNTDVAASTALTGVLLSQELASNDGKYILKSGDDGIGFYLVNSESTSYLSANRAYLSYTKPRETSMLKFNLGGETTGIHAIATDKAAETYYDLQGRRVLYPVHGVFVKGNGQKVYIK